MDGSNGDVAVDHYHRYLVTQIHALKLNFIFMRPLIKIKVAL